MLRVKSDRCKFFRNRKGGINLFCDGFVYRKKAKFRNTINWVCSKAPVRDGNNRLILCYGRCVTDEDGFVRLSKKGHNHLPVEIDFNDPDKFEFLHEINYQHLLIEPNSIPDVSNH